MQIQGQILHLFGQRKISFELRDRGEAIYFMLFVEYARKSCITGGYDYSLTIIGNVLDFPLVTWQLNRS